MRPILCVAQSLSVKTETRAFAGGQLRCLAATVGEAGHTANMLMRNNADPLHRFAGHGRDIVVFGRKEACGADLHAGMQRHGVAVTNTKCLRFLHHAQLLRRHRSAHEGIAPHERIDCALRAADDWIDTMVALLQVTLTPFSRIVG